MANTEQALWRAVIQQAIADASGKDACHPLDRLRAKDWLFKHSRDFLEVCALADVEPDQVRAQARKTIEQYSAKLAKREAKRVMKAQSNETAHPYA